MDFLPRYFHRCWQLWLREFCKLDVMFAYLSFVNLSNFSSDLCEELVHTTSWGKEI